MEKEEKTDSSAMLFLMEYGWAILAAIIAIGVLAYFGVFSPGKYVDNSKIPSNYSIWNETFEKRLNIECTKPNEILYIYYSNCSEETIPNIIKNCKSQIACDEKVEVSE